MNREQIARVAHEINRAYCASIGDDSLPAWEDAPDWQKASALAGVDMHVANPDATPEQSHESWLAQKKAEGWKFGKVKDPEKKEHPCMRVYAQLPATQRAKDYLFRAVVHLLKDAAAPAATPVSAAAPAAATVPVKYIGRRESYRDGTYASGITWQQGQTLLVPAALAVKLLKHADVYAGGDAGQGVPAVPAPSKVKEDEALQDLRDSISYMDKEAVAQFAKTSFRVELDPKLPLGEMRSAAIQLVDQYGPP